MATSGMDPAFGQAISALASGVSNLPESYAAGQRHLLAQQVAAFNQMDKDRNFGINKPLKEAQTRYHTAKSVEAEGSNLAAELFPELSRKLLRPVRGLNGEPDRIEFNDDPTVLADVMTNLTRRGINADNTINAYRGGVAGQLAAASKPGTSMPSANAQIAASRIGKDFGATTSSVFSVEDRDAVASEKERAAKDRLTTAQDGAWKRAQLSSDTSKANTETSQRGQDARTAATLKNQQEIAAARLEAGVGVTGRRETAISPEVMRLVEGETLADGRKVGGLAASVLGLIPTGSTVNINDARNVYAQAFYQAYRSVNPPNAPAAAQAAEAAARNFITGGSAAPAAATPAPGASAAAPAATTPAAAIVATTPPPPAATAYAAPAFSDPAQNIANARLDQIAASLNMSRQDLVELAKQQGMSVEEYVRSVNTPAAEPEAVEEPANLIDPAIVQNSGYTNLDTLRTPDTKTDLGAGIIPAADRLVDATRPASPLDPNSNEDLLSQITPEQQAILAEHNAQNPAQVLSMNAEPDLSVPPASPEEMARLTAEQEAGPAAAVARGRKGKGKGKGKKGKNAPAAAAAPAASPVAEAAVQSGDPLTQPNLLTGTNRGFPHPYHLNNFGKPDPLAATAPGTAYGNTYDTAFQPTPVDNSNAVLLSSITEGQTKPLNNIGLPRESVIDSRKYKPSDYLYKPDAVEQVMQASGIDRKSALGSRVEELHREKFVLMNSIASSSTPGTELTGGTQELIERLTKLNQKIDSITNNPYAKISPSAALIVEDFVNTPGLVVNSLSEIPNEANRKYVLKQSEVIHLLKTFTNVTPLPNGNFSVLYPMPTKDNQFVSKLLGQTSRYYATSTPDGAKPSGYIDGEKMFAAFDRAHADVQKLFIRDGKLGMKPGDSLARTLVNLTIRSNMEIAKAGQAGLLDELATPRNWFQGLIQYPFK
jgi:hypothetical protein